MIRLVVLALAALAFTAAPAQASSCKPPAFGDGYYYTLKVTKVRCATGRAVALAFTDCRHEDGKTGRCTRRVEGFSCHEKRGEAIRTEYSSSVRCRRGAKRVKFTYQQNT